MFSAEARLLFAPWRVYRELSSSLRDDPSPRAWILIRRPLLWLFVIAAFVSFTTSGRWIWFHLFATALMWSFVPLYQSVFIAWIARLLKSRRRIDEVVDLFFAGQAPWYLFLTVLAGVCIFAPDVWVAFQTLLFSGALIVVFVLTIVWSVLLTFAFFRSGLELSRGRAIAGCALFYLLFDGTIAAWYIATGQLWPLLFGVD